MSQFNGNPPLVQTGSATQNCINNNYLPAAVKFLLVMSDGPTSNATQSIAIQELDTCTFHLYGFPLAS